MSSSYLSGINNPDTTTAYIESITHEGHGVAHVDGKAVFIEGALPGETVLYRTLNRGKSYDLGRMIEIIEPSLDRVTPRCRYFGVCGGCSLQHLRAAAQLPAKQQILRDNLTRLGKVEAGSGRPPRANSTARRSTPTRVPQIEVAVGDNATAFVFRHLVPLTTDDDVRLADFGRQHDIQIFRQPGRPDQLVPVWPESPALLVYRLPEANVELEFAPADFIQVNAELSQRMVARALELLDPQPGESVLDLFCGLGNFTLPLARRAGRVLGIEADAALIEKAQRNARHNQIQNAQFRLADLYSTETPNPWGAERFDKWLLHPPRTRAAGVAERLAA